MPEELKKIDDILSKISMLLNKAMKKMIRMEHSGKEKIIIHLGEGMEAVLGAKSEIYKIIPDIKPANWEKYTKSEEEESFNSLLNALLMKTERLAEQGKQAKAIKVLDNFIKLNPPEPYLTTALEFKKRYQSF